MPPFLPRGPRIENAAAGKCFGERQRSGQALRGRGFGGGDVKDVMGCRGGRRGVHLFSLCIMWHTSITERKPEDCSL